MIKGTYGTKMDMDIRKSFHLVREARDAAMLLEPRASLVVFETALKRFQVRTRGVLSAAAL